MSARRPRKVVTPEPVLEGIDASLLDIVDHVLTKGIVLTGDLVLGVADIDLVYLRLSAVLCAADRVLGASPGGTKRRARHASHPMAGPRPIASQLGSPALGPAAAPRSQSKTQRTRRA